MSYKIPLVLSFGAALLCVLFAGRYTHLHHCQDEQEHVCPESDGATQLLEQEQLFTDRYSRVIEVCRNYQLGVFDEDRSLIRKRKLKSPYLERFFFDRVHNIAWCPIYKAASTSWLYNFCALGGMDEESLAEVQRDWHKVTREIWPEMHYYDGYQAFLSSSVSFFIVRHPFERLVSAYRDKLENKDAGEPQGTIWFYNKYGKYIADKYRRNGTSNRLEPTFEEFVRYLIDTDLQTGADEHWRPYHVQCTPCHLKFDVIVKFETLQRDQNYILSRAQVEHIVKPSWRHPSKGQATSSITKQYIATIDKPTLLKLYEKYKIDFEMFEYSINEYL